MSENVGMMPVCESVLLKHIYLENNEELLDITSKYVKN